MDRKVALYQSCFKNYLRTGHFEHKQQKPKQTESYVWRTEGDGKVRPSHSANDGMIFSWDNPPVTGHPGDEYGCRCRAEPYIEGETEFAYQVITEIPYDNSYSWEVEDFVSHAFAEDEKFGDVTLGETGRLKDVISHYAYVEDGGIYKRVQQQIIDEARSISNGSFSYSFGNSYNFKPVSFPLGSSGVEGEFKGSVSKSGNMLSINGKIDYSFKDNYTDPFDIREITEGSSTPSIEDNIWRRITDLGGKVYKITGEWETDFKAQVNVDERSGIYQKR